MKEVFVLGGGGFIGRNIVEHLIDRKDCNVTAGDIRKGSNWDEIMDDYYELELSEGIVISPLIWTSEEFLGKSLIL